MAPFHAVVVHNWRLKLSALGLAIFLWALVQTEPREAETFTVPVIVEVLDTAWAATGSPEPPTVELRLRGPTRDIIRLARQGTLVSVPITAVGSADTVVTLRRDWVGLGDGSRLSVESLSPSAVQIAFEPAVSRVVPLAIKTVGRLPADLALATPIGVNTSVVRLRGPASHLEGIDSVSLRPLDLSTVAKSGVIDVPVDTAGLGGVRITPMVATVGLRVEDMAERVVTGVAVVVQTDTRQGNIEVIPAAVDVVLRGAATLVQAVDSLDVRAWIGSELLLGMAVGEVREVPVRIEGVPTLVTAEVRGAVRVRRGTESARPPRGAP